MVNILPIRASGVGLVACGATSPSIVVKVVNLEIGKLTKILKFVQDILGIKEGL